MKSISSSCVGSFVSCAILAPAKVIISQVAGVVEAMIIKPGPCAQSTTGNGTARGWIRSAENTDSTQKRR